MALVWGRAARRRNLLRLQDGTRRRLRHQDRLFSSLPAADAGTDPVSFESVLRARRVVYVAGSNSAGRASVAAAAAVALAQHSPTLVVDADDPAHGMSDVLGTELAAADPVTLELPPRIKGPLIGARLSGTDTRELLSDLFGAGKWRKLIEEDVGAKLMASLGIPIGDVLSILDSVQPPPGVEMPVALAQLIGQEPADQSDRIVVDTGAPVCAIQMQSVPVAVSEGLRSVLKLYDLLKAASHTPLPIALSSGFRFVIGGQLGSKQESIRLQIAQTLEALEHLRYVMASLAALDRTILLVLPHHPGRAGEKAAARTIERLQPNCIAFSGYKGADAHLAPRPAWVPPGPAVITLPWGQERPSGIDELHTLAEAMSR